MAGVISTRLGGNPFEDEALEILKRYRAAGHGTREIIANALYALDGREIPRQAEADMAEFGRLVAEFAGLLAEMQAIDWGKPGAARVQVDELQERAVGVSDQLLGSIAKSVKGINNG